MLQSLLSDLEALAKSYDRDAKNYYGMSHIKGGSRPNEAGNADLQFAAVGSIYRIAAHDVRKAIKAARNQIDKGELDGSSGQLPAPKGCA